MKLTFSQTLAASQAMLPQLAGVRSDAGAARVLNKGYGAMYTHALLRRYGLTDERKRAFTDEVLRILVFQTEADAEAARLRGLVTGDAGLAAPMRHYLGGLKAYKGAYYECIGRLFKDDTRMMFDAVDVLCARYAHAHSAALRRAVRGLADYQKTPRPEVMAAAYTAEMMARYANKYTTEAFLRYRPHFPPQVAKHFARLDYAPMAKMLVTIRRRLEGLCGRVDFTGVKKATDAYARWMGSVEGITGGDIEAALQEVGGGLPPEG